MLSTPFNECARNAYSQFGEDGIIEEILHLLPRDKWCVEFGAWDGRHASNTYNLIKNQGYRAVLIEADEKKYELLRKNLEPHDAILLNRYVSFDGVDKLDVLLEGTPI